MKRANMGQVMAILMLGLAWGMVAHAQIIGGAEQAKFEPGDVTLFAEDFSSVPIGEPSPNFKLTRGTYEIAQFQGKKWIRPLDKGLGLTKPLRLPDEFSLEFVFYAFKDGGPWARVYLLSARGVTEWSGEDGERFVELEVGREHENDYVKLRAAEKPTFYPKEIALQRLKADQTHQISLQVRRGQLRLFVDGQRVAVIPFQPENPIEGLGFYWGVNYLSPTPYRDSPVLLTNFRIATYSKREVAPGKGGSSQLLLIMDKTKLEEKHPLREALKKFGAVEVGRGWWLPLPAEPFEEPGTWQVKLDIKAAEQWSKALKEILSQAKQLQPDAHLLVEGFAPEVAEAKEKPTEFWGRQLEFWLAGLRARALAFWLVQCGFEPEDLRTIP
ncbi:MAG: hypothetical protein ACK40X_02900 [Armatimonadota bacterium]